MKNYYLILILFIFLFQGCGLQQPIDASKWDKVVLTFKGPVTSEDAEVNPFTDYRLNVSFSHGEKTYQVPGYYAADGNAGETAASSGNIWRVIFRPDELGEWTYKVSFRMGENIGVDSNSDAGEPVAFDGTSGKIIVKSNLVSVPNFRAKGRLKYA